MPTHAPRRLLVSLAAATVIIGACGGPAADGDAPVEVVAALYPLAYAAERIGGDLVHVASVAPAGGHAHDTDVSSDHVDAIEDADVVVYVEGDLQPAVEDVARRQGNRAVAIAAGGDDPHFWLDPSAFANAVERIAEAIVDAVPESGRDQVEANAAALVDDLDALDRELQAGLAACERTSFVTTHAAFGHLARRYDLEQHAISGLEPESEPSPSRIADVAEIMRADGITTVFAEDAASEAIAETLAREVGANVAVLSPLESLSHDQAENGEDYLSIMRDNLDALRKALACS